MATQSTGVSKIRLSDEEINIIMDNLDALQRDAAGNQRRSERHRLRGRATVVVYETPNTTQKLIVRLRNVSIHGIGFLSATPMIPDTEFQIWLPTGAGGRMVDKVATVRRCNVAPKMLHEIGAEFVIS